MFTLEQIQEIQAHVRSGADFPAYVQSLAGLGVRRYHTYVGDGHTVFESQDGETLRGDAKYPPMDIAAKGDEPGFGERLLLHQQGQTDFPTFCRDAAAGGVDGWAVDIDAMTCTYFDRSGSLLLKEDIPQAAEHSVVSQFEC